VSDTGVLEADGEATPIEEATDSVACNVEGCGYVADPAWKLGIHKWQAHRIRRDPDAPKPKKKPAAKPSPAKSKNLRARLEMSIGVVGVGVGMLNSYDGQVIHNGTPSLATALADWAEVDPVARKYIEYLAFDAPWFGVAMVLVSMGFPIAANHGVVKKVPPMFSGFAPGGSTPLHRVRTEENGKPEQGQQMDVGTMMQTAMKDPDFAAFAQGVMGGTFKPPAAGAPAESPAEEIIVP
jgi:hypothetical protein